MAPACVEPTSAPAEPTQGVGFDLLDAALLDLALEYILPKVPLKALARLTLASHSSHALVLRAISAASFWEERSAVFDRIKASRPISSKGLLWVVEQASGLVEKIPSRHPSLTSWEWRGDFQVCEAIELPWLFRALVSPLMPPEIIKMVIETRPFKLRLTLDKYSYPYPPADPALSVPTGWASLGHELAMALHDRRAAWTTELVLQLARALDLIETDELMAFASWLCDNPIDVAHLLAADLPPSQRPAFYVTALSADHSASPAIEPLVALARGEPLQFVLDAITAFAAADERETLAPFWEAEHAECFAAGFVEAWAREVDFPRSWSLPDRLAVAHAVASCNEAAKTSGVSSSVGSRSSSIRSVHFFHPRRRPTSRSSRACSAASCNKHSLVALRCQSALSLCA